MLISSPCMEMINETKRMIVSNFDMKDMREANVILGIKVTRVSDGLRLSQEHYVEKFLKKFGYYDSKPLATPFDPNIHL